MQPCCMIKLQSLCICLQCSTNNLVSNAILRDEADFYSCQSRCIYGLSHSGTFFGTQLGSHFFVPINEYTYFEPSSVSKAVKF